MMKEDNKIETVEEEAARELTNIEKWHHLQRDLHRALDEFEKISKDYEKAKEDVQNLNDRCRQAEMVL